MKRLLSALFAAALIIVVTAPVRADVGCRGNGSNSNCATPAITTIDFKYAAGSDFPNQTGLVRPLPVLSSTMYATGVANGGATSMASTTAAIPVSYSYIKTAIATDAAFSAKTLANGLPGQILTIRVVAIQGGGTTGGNFVLTPATSYGFSTIKLSAVNDVITLQFVDSTSGWTIAGMTPGASNSITVTDVAGK